MYDKEFRQKVSSQLPFTVRKYNQSVRDFKSASRTDVLQFGIFTSMTELRFVRC